MSARQPNPLVPARLALREDGTPWSEVFDDIYHSSDGGPEQAEAVFLRGNALPHRWAGRSRFVILETGFGLGLNFLVTWAAWQADPRRCARLHYIAVELHPFRVDDLRVLHARWPALGRFAAELQAHWPTLTPGFHRIHLAGGQVVLTLLLGDAGTLLPQLEARVDAFYLDGFSPAHNPALWHPALFRRLARLAAPEATLATWSVAGEVRRGLDACGFECTRQPGFGGKRERLTGRLRDVATSSLKSTARNARQALVLGAGLAGSAIANRLAERDWSVTVIDAGQAIANGASGNLAGVLRPLPSLDDNRLGRLTRAGTLYGLAHLTRLQARAQSPRWSRCGALHLARDQRQWQKQAAVAAAHCYPKDYLQHLSAEDASRIAFAPVNQGGWWLPAAAWVNPPSLCAANLQAWPGVTLLLGKSVTSLQRIGAQWHAFDPLGDEIARASVVILANGTGMRGLEQAAWLPVGSARGQVTHLPAAADSPPKVIVCGQGYVSPEVDGLRCAGATFAVGDPDPALRAGDQQDNLDKLEQMLPGYPYPALEELSGRVGFRPISPDRLPMVGALPTADAATPDTPLSRIPRQPDLYAIGGFGARGLVWSSLVAELLASQLDADPLPLERELVEAIDPARFLIKPVHGFALNE